MAHAARKTPLSHGNTPCSNRSTPKWKAADRYTRDSYRRAVHRAVEKINRIRRKKDKHAELLEKWSPNRLRHSAATAIRKRFGLEAAQVILGHAAADVTQIYAERDLDKAIEVAKQVG
ncbi:MAG: tyrosine-type recombinase/integrase [Pirellulaceae bacterium]